MNGTDDASVKSRPAVGRKPFWRSTGYLSWLTADTASAIGLSLRTLALSLVGYSVSGSTVSAGWLGTAAMIAQQAMGMFGGTFVDRHGRRKLIFVNSLAGMLSWGLIAFLIATGGITFPLLLAVSVITSGVNGFLGSATDAMLRSIIDMREYPRARSLNEGRDATIGMAANPISGFLYGTQAWLPFLVSSFAYAVAGVAATGIRERGGERKEKERAVPQSFLKDFAEGWSWSLRRPLLVTILIAASLINFAVNGIQYAIQLHLVSTGTNATYIGLVGAGISLAMLIGSFISGRLSDRAPVGITVCLAFAFTCIAASPLLALDDYWGVLICNSLIGLSFPTINAMLLGFVFAKSPTNMQGRIATTLTIPAQVLSSFCSAVAGSLLPSIGFHGTVLVFILILLASTILVMSSRPIRHIPRSSQWHDTRL